MRQRSMTEKQRRYDTVALYPHRWIVVEYFTKVVAAAGSPEACVAAARLLNMETP